MYKSIVVLYSLSLVILTVNCDSLPVRQTANGPIEGTEQTSSLGQKYFAFKGVRYAEPPITGIDQYGEQVDRRFKPPVPIQHDWKENSKANNFGTSCIPTENLSNLQLIADITSEDCLFVNIYEPADGAKKKTVLVWIHGGAFALGDAKDDLYGPDFLLGKDNVIVTVQYRLGIFGFLNLGSDEYSGNMGLKDQRLALKWVYENIENFSGNKDEILLFGESAGGASTGFHLLNEESRKYFKRAFLSSSTVFSPYASAKANHLQRMRNFSQINDDEELLEYLRTTDSATLSKINPIYGLPPSWVPTIENANAIQPFLTKSPVEVYESNPPIKDVMFSFNSKESIPFWPELLNDTDPLIKEKLEDSELELQFEGFNKTTQPEAYKQMLEELRSAYYSDSSDTNSIRNANIDLMSDMHFGDSILKGTILQTISNNGCRHNRKNTFLYRFSSDAGLNIFKIILMLDFDGAGHADDVCYIFHCHILDNFKLYDKHLAEKDATYDKIMQMVNLVTNFARTGNPSIEDDTPFKSCKSPDEIYCQEIPNGLKTTVTNNIKDQLHYNTWREVEDIYENVNSAK